MTNGNEIIYDSKACLFTSCPIKDQNIDIENHEVNDYVKVRGGEKMPEIFGGNSKFKQFSL